MSDLVMRCNDLQCRAELTDKAVVTTCSHIFCLPCAQNNGLFQQQREQRACPACGAGLFKDDDCVATALNPSEDYKSSVLCGLNPTIIMECASRALEFYSYQATNAVMYQEHLAQSLTAKYKLHTDQLRQQSQDLSQELGQAREVARDYRKSCDRLEGKYHELSLAFKEKSKALAETQSKYQQIKTQAMLAEVQYAASEDAEHAMRTPILHRPAPRPGPLFLRANSASAFSGPGLGRVPLATVNNNLYMNRSNSFTSRPSLHRRHPSQLSPSGSIDRSIGSVGLPNAHLPGIHKTRLPMPVGMSVNSHTRVPSRSATHSQGHHQPSKGFPFPGQAGPIKRSRTGPAMNDRFG